MRIDPVTARYVDALFELALEQGQLDAVQRDVERLAQALAQTSSAALFDPRLPRDRRAAVLEPLLAGLSKLVQNFCRLAFERRREDVLRDVGAAFRARALAHRGVVVGQLESARELAPADVAALAKALGARLGCSVELETRVDPTLMAGLRATVSNKLFDLSARGRLEGLRRALLDAPLPPIPDRPAPAGAGA